MQSRLDHETQYPSDPLMPGESNLKGACPVRLIAIYVPFNLQSKKPSTSSSDEPLDMVAALPTLALATNLAEVSWRLFFVEGRSDNFLYQAWNQWSLLD